MSLQCDPVPRGERFVEGITLRSVEADQSPSGAPAAPTRRGVGRAGLCGWLGPGSVRFAACAYRRSRQSAVAYTP